MDAQTEKQRRHRIRLIITEAIMTLAVAVTVTVLALLASGYWLNSDLEVERQGMLQISSVPTGAYVEIDGVTSSWLERTNTSKVLSAGEHTISLAKDGYDTWSRTITVREGLLYRIHYPRLFLLERESTPVYDVKDYTFATISPDNDFALLTNSTTNWLLLNLTNDKLDPRPLDVSKIIPENAAILAAKWSENHERVLLKIQTDATTEWILLNPRNLTNSLNLTETFAADFTEVEILDNSATNLLAVKDGNLHKIDISTPQISPILVKNVLSFDHYGSEVVFVAENAISSVPDTADAISSALDIAEDATSSDSSVENSTIYYIGVLNAGSSQTNEITALKEPARVLISKFYDTKYLTVLTGQTVTVYEKDNLEKSQTREISFVPEIFKVGHSGEFIQMISGATFATLDMEAQDIREWQIDSAHFGEFDTDMLYAISGSDLMVYDFDGLNRRTLATDADRHYPATITNDKWLYYFKDGQLIRVVVN